MSATQLQSDAQGFLVGDLIDLSRETLELQERGLTILEVLRRDVGRIAKFLRPGKAPQEPARRRSPDAQAAAALRQRDDKGRFVAQPAAAGAKTAGSALKPPGELPPVQGVPSLGVPPSPPAPTVVVNVAVPGEPARRTGPLPARDTASRFVPASPQVPGEPLARAADRVQSTPPAPVTLLVSPQAAAAGAPGPAGKRGQRGSSMPARDPRREPVTAAPRERVQGTTATSQPARAAGAARTVAAPVVRFKNRSRDDGGRFVAGHRRPGAPRLPGENDHDSGTDRGLSDRIGKLGDAIKGIGNGVDQIDPSIAAAHEVKQVLEPFGRGAAAIFGRNPERQKERKRERWYTRILKAISGKKDQPAQTAGGAGGDVKSGSFFGTLFGGLIGKVMGSLGAAFGGILPALGGLLMRVFGPVAAAWAGWQIGQWLGEKIYEWLDKAGIATKVFDAFDAIGKWWKDKVADPVKNAIKKVEEVVDNTVNEYKVGRDQAANPQKMAPAIVGQDGRNINDPRRLDRAQAVGDDGRALNDPRRLDATVEGKLPPVTSIAQGIGRVVGSFQSGQDYMAGEGGKVVARKGIKRVVATGEGFNDVERADGSVERQRGARNWRNNNPGNIEYGDFAKKQGAIGSDGRFAIFPDYQTGRKAKESLIFDGRNYKDLSLTDAVARYAPPGENNTALYQKAVLAAAGGKNKRMSEYSPAERTAIMDAMEKQEGFKVGKTTLLKPGDSTVPAPGATAVAAAGSVGAVDASGAAVRTHFGPPAGVAGSGRPGATSAGAPATAGVTGVQAGAAVQQGGASAAPAMNQSPRVPAQQVQVSYAAMPAPRPAAVPIAVPERLPDAPQVTAPEPASSLENERPVVAVVREPIGQDVGDRAIAHIVTGGLGGA